MIVERLKIDEKAVERAINHVINLKNLTAWHQCQDMIEV